MLAGIDFITLLTFSLQLKTPRSTTASTTSDITTEQFGIVCPVLNLRLAPIHLTLLGLHVDTSDICLAITAIQGGGLLRNLLCGLAGGDTTTLPIILSLLQNLLSNSLSSQQMLFPSGVANSCSNNSTSSNICTDTCQVPNPVIGPVNLNLLGLVVMLNDCSGGPVRVCVSATRSEGLLGSLLCSLAGQ